MRLCMHEIMNQAELQLQQSLMRDDDQALVVAAPAAFCGWSDARIPYRYTQGVRCGRPGVVPMEASGPIAAAARPRLC